MPEKQSVDDRLANLEKELAKLKRQVNGNDTDKSNWITRMTGQFKDDPVFEEIARLGKEIRDAEQPDYDDETE